ncbi:hypothetical protein C8Q69DRAFT_508463 [Paecilomyces variotii]|uniref:Uncharacterized protein n=1 Tax=Byssochlamys spectabilis TaxID=264951 RepID=A0A443HQR4_BYSSP|nr:hypothetical protein C8Q69DRAFT_508463 [Paecilomyces variotii]RWQ94120.1 hypothetical protein C8Q69DRAFT_508463 [Paecilomyces variotii]
MGSAVSVCPSGWLAGLALFCFVRFWNVPRRDPSKRLVAGSDAAASSSSFSSSRPPQRQRKPFVLSGRLSVETHFLCLVQVREERLSQRGDETSELDVGGEDAGDRTANEPGQEQDRRSVRNGEGAR